MKIAIYPGTFDPVTAGHLDILHEAASLFDKVVAAVGINPGKVPTFTAGERVQLLQEAISEANLPNVEVAAFEGLTVDCARAHQARFIVRGLRAVTDFENELALLLANEQLDSEIKTVFVMPSHKHLYLSSSIVRQAAEFGRRVIPGSVPTCVENKLKEKFDF
ncbi:MAG TPA: pantetheine-phosphate adenylyltransferase [Abditibacteriaceae bacterium]|jgi:pantetheine-phosphate adenylyltransferase